jgi:hypothetical protein
MPPNIYPSLSKHCENGYLAVFAPSISPLFVAARGLAYFFPIENIRFISLQNIRFEAK